MAWAEGRASGWRACWRGPEGRKLYEPGFKTKTDALNHARDQEAEQRRRGRRSHSSARLTVEDWANDWFESLDLDLATERQYRGILENHVLPRWGDWLVRDLADADAEVTIWVKEMRVAGYSDSRIAAIRGRFHTLCADAVERGLLYRNPAAVQRARGRAAPRRARKAAEREQRSAVADPLRALLAAERAAVLTGRDDEFVLLITAFYTGMRWGELAGVEKTDLHLDKLEVNWQLADLGGLGLARKVPKYGSVRRLDLPLFLARLLAEQAERVRIPADLRGLRWCPCGRDLEESYRHQPGVHVFSGPGAAHWDHSRFLPQCWHPAMVGRFFAGDRRRERPVYVDEPAEGWEQRDLHMMDYSRKPSTRSVKRADVAVACWVPIVPGMRRFHGMRHSHASHLEELGVPGPLRDERMGHHDGSVQARYAHPTPAMRVALTEGLSEAWEASLEGRAAMDPYSPVPVLDGLLGAYRDDNDEYCPQSAPSGPPRRLRGTRGTVA